MKSSKRSLSVIRKTLVAYVLLSFYAMADTAENYEKALAAFNEAKYAESYIHLKNSLKLAPEHLPSKLLMGRILLIDGHTEAAITEFKEVIAAGADVNLVVIPLANAHLIRQEYQEILDLAEPFNSNTATKLDLLLLKATSHMKRRDFAQAKSTYYLGQKKFGDNPLIINGLTQIALIEKDLDKARNFITTSLALDPKNGQSLLLSGLIYQAEKQPKMAMKDFLQAYQYAPENPGVKRSLANSYAQAGMVSEANILVEEIEKQSPGDLQTKLLKARLLTIAGRNTEASAALSDLSHALSVTDEASREELTSLSLVAGITAYVSQNYDISVREFERYLKSEEANIELVTMLTDAYMRLGNDKQAIQTLERYEPLIVENVEVSSKLCNLYLVNSKLYKCVTLLEKLKIKHGEKATLLLLEAKLSSHRGRPEDALRLTEKLMIDSESIDIVLFRTSLLAQMNRFEEALGSSRRLLTTAPDNVAYINLNVDLLIRTNDLLAAETMLQQVFKLDPENIAGLVNQARILFGLSNYDEALLSINQVLKEQPANSTALLLSGQILSKQKQFDKAIEQLIACKTLQSKNPDPRELLVSIYKEQQRFDLALKEVDQLLTLDRLESRYILEKAKLLIETGETEQAKNQLNLLFAQWSNDPTRLLELSKYQVAANDTEGAENSLKQTLINSPNLLLARLEYSKFLLNQNKIEEVRSLVEELQKSHPKNPNVALLYGNYSQAIGQTEQAYWSYKKAFELSPDFTLALIELYQLASKGIHSEEVKNLLLDQLEVQPQADFHRHLLADLYFLSAEFSQAREHYLYLINVEGLINKANIFNNLANITSDTDVTKALAYAEKATELNPNSAPILDTKGWLLTLNGNFQEGLNLLRQAFILQSNNLTIRYHLAYTLYKLERYEEAKAELKLILQTNQDFPEQLKAKQLLSEISLT